MVEAVAGEAVSALRKPRNPEKQGIFALSGLEIAAQMRKLHEITVTYAIFRPKNNRESSARIREPLSRNRDHSSSKQGSLSWSPVMHGLH